uniref:Anaphase-promoting complex subunit 4 WD40 domain-containing protein n=1 Tax=Amphimedon queenslandica TaxID=400682 RepID=A0A1X7VDW0_AMPQE
MISGDGPVSNMIWTLPGVLATCSQEPAIRFWDTIENDNYSLLLKDYCQMDDNEMDIVCSIKYDANNGLLLAVTNKGKSLIWSRNEETSQWDLNTFIIAKGPVSCISWGSGKHLLATCNGTSVNIHKEHAVSSHYCEEVSAVQLTVNSVVVQSHSSPALIRMSTDVMISGLTLSPDHIALWDGAKVYLYSLAFNKGNYNFIGCFNSSARSVVLYETNVYTVQDGELCIHSVVGVLKNKLSLDINEVGGANLRVSGHHLVISFADGNFKVFDLKRREPKLICTKSVSQYIHHFVNVVSGQANSNGTLIGLIANKVKFSHDHVL